MVAMTNSVGNDVYFARLSRGRAHDCVRPCKDTLGERAQSRLSIALGTGRQATRSLKPRALAILRPPAEPTP
eukprot:6829327-Pyramimonas_sp.AAC.1